MNWKQVLRVFKQKCILERTLSLFSKKIDLSDGLYRLLQQLQQQSWLFSFGATKEETVVPVSTERPIQLAASALGGHLSTVAAPSISSQQDSFLSQQPVIISKDSQYGEFVSNTGVRPSVSALDVLNFAFQDDTKSILMEIQLSNISNINSFYGTVLPSALFLNIVGQ